MKIDFVLKNFFDDIQNQIYNSDIIFARCGSSTLAEIENCKKSAFLFPLPSSLDNHQFLNAMEHKKINNCEIFDERNIIPLSGTREGLFSFAMILNTKQIYIH